MLLSSGQSASQIGRNHTLALLRYGAGDQNFFQWTILPKLPQANREKAKFLRPQTFFRPDGNQMALFPDREGQHSAALHFIAYRRSRRIRVHFEGIGLKL